MRFVEVGEDYDPATIDVALVAKPQAGVLAALTRVKLLQSLWMGVDGLLAESDLPRNVPIARLVDPTMTRAMSETVLAHVLACHRQLHRYRDLQREQRWQPLKQPRAFERSVGLLGLGELGQDAAKLLAAIGFRVLGWSRTLKEVHDVACFTGEAGLYDMLAQSEIVVCLLPLTRATHGVLDARAFAAMPAGACVINVARGAHVVERDLLAALDRGHLAHALLDVFEVEPLPPAHPLWTHPRVTVTPHVAAATIARYAVEAVVENLERVQRGEAPRYRVDPARGY